jgi:hypothetical protein
LSFLVVLIAAPALLLALGAVTRFAPRRVPGWQAVICLVGLAAALFTPGVAVIEAGPAFATDGLSSTVLAALFLLGASGAAGPVATGAAALAMLSGDAITLIVFTAAASFIAPAWRTKSMALGSLAVALLLLAWHGAIPDPRFVAIRELPPSTVAGGFAVLALLTAAAATSLALPAIPGALLSFYLGARLLLDLPGPITPGWWGVPVLLLGTASAALMARRAAAAVDLGAAITSALQSILALAFSGIGVALLARGADLPPLAALAMTASLLLLLTTALWGGLALLAANAIQQTVGTTALTRLGGLLRRVPVTSLALLIAMLSLSAVPLTAGFAAFWTLLQALLGTARLGGTGLLALSAGAVAALGLVVALLAATAFRLVGAALLGLPRSGKSAAAVEPSVFVRAAMGVLACVLIVAGLVPSLLVAIAQPAIRQLTGAAAEGATPWGLASTADAPGYAVPALAAILAVTTGLATWASQGETVRTPVWRGGLPEDGPARANTYPLLLWPGWRTWRAALSPRLVLGGLAVILAAALGWAAR